MPSLPSTATASQDKARRRSSRHGITSSERPPSHARRDRRWAIEILREESTLIGSMLTEYQRRQRAHSLLRRLRRSLLAADGRQSERTPPASSGRSGWPCDFQCRRPEGRISVEIFITQQLVLSRRRHRGQRISTQMGYSLHSGTAWATATGGSK